MHYIGFNPYNANAGANLFSDEIISTSIYGLHVPKSLNMVFHKLYSKRARRYETDKNAFKISLI